jgi:hypothetical protein
MPNSVSRGCFDCGGSVFLKKFRMLLFFLTADEPPRVGRSGVRFAAGVVVMLPGHPGWLEMRDDVETKWDLDRIQVSGPARIQAYYWSAVLADIAASIDPTSLLRIRKCWD